MDMEVRYFLMAVPTDIGQQAVSGCWQSSFARDMTNRADEACNLGVARHRAEIIPAHVTALGDNKDVDRCLRIDIVKGECPLDRKSVV